MVTPWRNKEVVGERDKTRNNARCTQVRKTRTAWMDNINTWKGLPVEESVRMTEDRDKLREYVHGVTEDEDQGRLKNRTETDLFTCWATVYYDWRAPERTIVYSRHLVILLSNLSNKKYCCRFVKCYWLLLMSSNTHITQTRSDLNSSLRFSIIFSRLQRALIRRTRRLAHEYRQTVIRR